MRNSKAGMKLSLAGCAERHQPLVSVRGTRQEDVNATCANRAELVIGWR
jgi:hypothetical protein